MKEKKKKIGIIIGGIVGVIVLVAIIVGICISSDSPKKSVETMLNELKLGTYSQFELPNVFQEENMNQEVPKLLFDKLEWKVQNIKEEGDKATVEVEITNKDFNAIISNFMQKIIKIAWEKQNVNQEEISNYLIEELKNTEIQTITSNQSIILEKKDGKWQVSEENNFTDILLPGFNQAISNFQ